MPLARTMQEQESLFPPPFKNLAIQIAEYPIQFISHAGQSMTMRQLYIPEMTPIAVFNPLLTQGKKGISLTPHVPMTLNHLVSKDISTTSIGSLTSLRAAMLLVLPEI
jgi:hypothetical protein